MTYKIIISIDEDITSTPPETKNVAKTTAITKNELAIRKKHNFFSEDEFCIDEILSKYKSFSLWNNDYLLRSTLVQRNNGI